MGRRYYADLAPRGMGGRRVAAIAVLALSIFGCRGTPTVHPSEQASPTTSDPPIVVELAIHPNAATNDALVVGSLRIEGRCLFIVTDDGTRLGVAWPAGTRWNPLGGSIVVKGSEVPLDTPVAIGGGSADITPENLHQTPWIVAPRAECLGDGFVFAGTVGPLPTG